MACTLSPGRTPPRLAGCAVFAMIALSAGPSAAQVIEIGDDGAVVTYTGPMQFFPEGARPIGTSVPTQAPRTPASNASPDGVVAAAIERASSRQTLSPLLLSAVAWRESRFNQGAISPKGARGVMQLMPQTARSLGVDPADLEANVAGGAAYLASLMRRYDGDLRRALAAYNAGPAAVDRYGGVPPFPETVAYVDAILERLSQSTARASGALR